MENVENSAKKGCMPTWLLVCIIGVIMYVVGCYLKGDFGANYKKYCGTYSYELGGAGRGLYNCYVLTNESVDEYSKKGSRKVINDKGNGQILERFEWYIHKDRYIVVDNKYGDDVVIDYKHKKIYNSYGEFLDKRNGIPYKFKSE